MWTLCAGRKPSFLAVNTETNSDSNWKNHLHQVVDAETQYTRGLLLLFVSSTHLLNVPPSVCSSWLKYWWVHWLFWTHSEEVGFPREQFQPARDWRAFHIRSSSFSTEKQSLRYSGATVGGETVCHLSLRHVDKEKIPNLLFMERFSDVRSRRCS